MSESVRFVDLNFSNGKEISGFDHSLDELCDPGISGSIQTEDEADTGSISKKEGMEMKHKRKRKSESKLKSEMSEETENKRMNIKREPRVSKYQDLYFKEGTDFVCIACNAHYKSMHGIYCHLKITVCGFGQKEGTQKKVQHTNHYTRVNDRIICDICGKEYNSLRGIYHHLANSPCGKEERPEKPKTEPVERTARKDYSSFYRLIEAGEFICNSCQGLFKSLHGMHSHLNQKVCGFGQEEVKTSYKNYWSSFYHMDEEKFVCSTCLRSFNNRTAIYRHLKTSVACLGDNPVTMAETVKYEQRVEIEVKPDLSPSSNIILDMGDEAVSVNKIENLENEDEDTVDVKVKPDNPPSSYTTLDIDLD